MKKRLDIEDNPDRWLVSYADFITLMFAFFVVLYATSTRDLEKTKEFQDAVKKYLIKVGAFGGSGEKIEQGEKHNTPIEPPIQTFQNSAAPAEKVYERLLEIVETKIEGRFGEALIDLSGDEMGVRLVMSSPSLFVEKSNLLKEEALPILNAIVALAIELNKKILVEGHAPPDAQPNPWIAGAQQSSQIVRYWIQRQGMPKDRIAVMSLGDQRPMVKETDSRARSFNQRIEVVILNEESVF